MLVSWMDHPCLPSVLWRNRQAISVVFNLASDQQAVFLHVFNSRAHSTHLPELHQIAAVLQQLSSNFQVLWRFWRFFHCSLYLGFAVRISNAQHHQLFYCKTQAIIESIFCVRSISFATEQKSLENKVFRTIFEFSSKWGCFG